MDLVVVIALFAASALVVVGSGLKLAKYGDLLAIKTGWGRLWVGTLLVAGATSLPELVTGVSAAQIDSPDLVTGNVFGANMVNMFTMALVAVIFGARKFFDGVAPEHGYLATVAITLTLTGALLGAFGPEWSVARMGVGTPLILLLYIAGMGLVYIRRPADEEVGEEYNDPSITLRRTWLYFGLASAGVIAAAPVLAYSANEVAEITGLEAGFVGVVAVALVTTLPEATVTVASVRIGAMDLAAGNLYGSCAFNIFVLAIADPFYAGGPLLGSQTVDTAQVVAALFAIGLMGAGMAQFILRRHGKGRLPPTQTSLAMCTVYIVGLLAVFRLS